ncbi:hypothetical protein [Paenibacillus wynnii]|uniref:hypothetical protein n=1 Tax=Paenibacillus wynnii TaxID=268407 RepID=UPI002793FD17|nr:hypothetical protein [Paenibacillus wynnii]MDQ0196433.1 hypothetical protein [Paenibacillus wynnii]
MKVWLRLLLIAVIIFIVSSVVWFLLGSTAYFQRGMDIIGTTYLLGAGIPVLLFAILFTILLTKRWSPTDGVDYVGICVALVISTLLAAALIQSVSTNGWSNENIESDSIQITADEKYEYRTDLINLFQRNSSARLYLKEVGLGEEVFIPVDIQTGKIVGLGVSEVNHWVMLEPTDEPSRYILYTTKELGIPIERFKIDTVAGTSERVE